MPPRPRSLTTSYFPIRVPFAMSVSPAAEGLGGAGGLAGWPESTDGSVAPSSATARSCVVPPMARAMRAGSSHGVHIQQSCRARDWPQVVVGIATHWQSAALPAGLTGRRSRFSTADTASGGPRAIGLVGEAARDYATRTRRSAARLAAQASGLMTARNPWLTTSPTSSWTYALLRCCAIGLASMWTWSSPGTTGVEPQAQLDRQPDLAQQPLTQRLDPRAGHARPDRAPAAPRRQDRDDRDEASLAGELERVGPEVDDLALARVVAHEVHDVRDRRRPSASSTSPSARSSPPHRPSSDVLPDPPAGSRTKALSPGGLSPPHAERPGKPSARRVTRARVALDRYVARFPHSFSATPVKGKGVRS